MQRIRGKAKVVQVRFDRELYDMLARDALRQRSGLSTQVRAIVARHYAAELEARQKERALPQRKEEAENVTVPCPEPDNAGMARD